MDPIKIMGLGPLEQDIPFNYCGFLGVVVTFLRTFWDAKKPAVQRMRIGFLPGI